MGAEAQALEAIIDQAARSQNIDVMFRLCQRSPTEADNMRALVHAIRHAQQHLFGYWVESRALRRALLLSLLFEPIHIALKWVHACLEFQVLRLERVSLRFQLL